MCPINCGAESDRSRATCSGGVDREISTEIDRTREGKGVASSVVRGDITIERDAIGTSQGNSVDAIHHARAHCTDGDGFSYPTTTIGIQR